MNIGFILHRNAKRFPDKAAFINDREGLNPASSVTRMLI
jgi:hypothetical protein